MIQQEVSEKNLEDLFTCNSHSMTPGRAPCTDTLESKETVVSTGASITPSSLPRLAHVRLDLQIGAGREFELLGMSEEAPSPAVLERLKACCNLIDALGPKVSSKFYQPGVLANHRRSGISQVACISIFISMCAEPNLGQGFPCLLIS